MGEFVPKYPRKLKSEYLAQISQLVLHHGSDKPIQQQRQLIRELVGNDQSDEAEEFSPEIGRYAVSGAEFQGNDWICFLTFEVLTSELEASSDEALKAFFADLTQLGFRVAEDPSSDEDKGILTYVVGKNEQ